MTEKKPVIIAMTAFALEGDKKKCIDAGMDDYISKPFMIEEIEDSIRKWSSSLNNKKQEAGNPIVKETVSRLVLNPNTLNRLKEMTRGSDTTFFKKVLQMFIDQGDQMFIEIENALLFKDINKLGSFAHKLKGSALNLGAEVLAETCRIIELKGRNSDSTGIEELIKELYIDYKTTKEQLLAIIEKTV